MSAANHFVHFVARAAVLEGLGGPRLSGPSPSLHMDVLVHRSETRTGRMAGERMEDTRHKQLREFQSRVEACGDGISGLGLETRLDSSSEPGWSISSRAQNKKKTDGWPD